MKQTILVTGGTGFIGSHTTVELQEAGYNVVIADNLSNSKIEVLDGIEKITGIRPAFEKVNLEDKEATERVFQKYPNIEGIIHFAASKAVGESVEKPLMYYRNNVVSLINLLEMMPKYEGDKRTNHLRLHTQRRTHQEYRAALFQPDWRTPNGTYRRIAQWCAQQSYPLRYANSNGNTQATHHFRQRLQHRRRYLHTRLHLCGRPCKSPRSCYGTRIGQGNRQD